MKVKFTNPTNSNEVLFGTITGMNGKMFTILRETGVGKIYMVNPNDDYNFGFILSAKGKLNFADTGLKGEYLRDVKNGVKGIRNALKSGDERNIIHNYDIVQQRVQQYGEGPNKYDFLDAVQKLAGIDEDGNFIEK